MNKCYVKSLEETKQEFLDFDIDRFVNKYKKVDVFIGDSESIKFIKKILKENLFN